MKKTAFKLISLILSLTMFICLLPLSATAEDAPYYPTGLIWSDEETLSKIPVDNIATMANTTKTSVDLTDKFPDPGNQNPQSSCVGWAVAYLKSGQETIKRGWSAKADSHMFSPSYIYNILNGGKDEGISIPDAINIVAALGVCSINYFPYEKDNYTKQPSSIALNAASLYKASVCKQTTSVQDIKNHLANNQGVVIGVKVYPDLRLLSILNPIYDNTIGNPEPGGHAICLIGFDDSKGAFKFINSWGTIWGLGGYGWISYKLVEDTTVNRHGAGVGFYMDTVKDDYILGDVNGDGKITTVDSKLILEHVAGTKTLTNKQFALADVNGDAKVTTVDSKNILKYVSGEITKMPLYN